MGDEGVIAGLVQRDRAITFASLLLLTTLSWVYLIRGSARAHDMGRDSAPPAAFPRAAAAPDEAHSEESHTGESGEDEDAPGYVPP